MQTNSLPKDALAAAAVDQSQLEVAESLSERILAESRRAHDPQRMVESLIAERQDVIVVFRAAFAAHRFDVTSYTDDEIGRAICIDSGLSESPTSHERLRRAFKRLQSRG